MSGTLSKARTVTAFIAIGVGGLLVLFSPFLCSKRSVELISKGKVVAVATRPFGELWGDVDVCVEKSKLFSLWGGDIYDGPLLIHPLEDSERFLCVYDYDVEIFACVVDFSGSATNASKQGEWPSNDSHRAAFAGWATNVVLQANGAVRLPSCEELQEASANLASLSSSQFKSASFSRRDVGIYRFYVPKETVLFNLRTNREF